MTSWSKTVRMDRPASGAMDAARGWFARALAALLERAMGHLAERAAKTAHRQSYSVATIVLAAKLAKVDGPIVRAEIDAFKSVFKIPADELGDVARIWTAARSHARGFEVYAHRLAILFDGDRELLENLLSALIHVARADGPLNAAEIGFLERVARAFGLEHAAVAHLRAKIETPAEDDPYTVLGVSPQASDEEIKRAWRRLVRVYHPDTAMADGRARNFIELAQQKTAAINAAYDAIERHRMRAA